MIEKPTPEGQIAEDRAEENGESPMLRFQTLTSSLLHVNPEKLKEAQEIYNCDKAKARKATVKI